MINERGVEIANHLQINDINGLISECKTQIRFLKRLIFIKLLMQDSTILEAAEFVGYTERTGYNWLKSYNKKGLDGLIPNFGGGRPSFLTEEQLKELHEILKDKNSNFTIEDTRILIHEKFGIKYSYKQVWEITRKKLKLNYSKPSPKAHDRPKNRKEILKKTKSVNWETDYIGFLDTTAVQNIPNTVRTLYEPGTKNSIMKNTEKFKINATGFQGVNCRSILQFTTNTRAHEMGKIIVELRLVNTDSIEGQNLLLDVLINPNLTEEYVVNELKRKRDSAYEYREKINDKIYDERMDYDSTNKNIINYAKRQDPHNINKKDEEKRENLLKNLNTNEIITVFKNEPKLHIVLDNYKVHHTPLIKNICEILNINLIYLPPKSPDLNPIEDVWEACKRIIKNSYIIDKEHLKIIFENSFYIEVNQETYYEKLGNRIFIKLLKKVR